MITKFIFIQKYFKDLIIAFLIGGVMACNVLKENKENLVVENIDFAVSQVKLQLEQIEKSRTIMNPMTLIDGKVKYIHWQDWTSGFFSGTLWYLYELTGDSVWKNQAIRYTETLDSVKYLTWHHDVGFMIQCSYGNGLRINGNNSYQDVIIQAAKSLSTRYRPEVGIIQSWNVDQGWQSERGWECPVIIDNMMNLELLFNATRLSGDSLFRKIALNHADKTMENQFRSNYSCWHVIDYSLKDGSVRSKQTAQGYSHESAWARGQAWAIYGFTVCYRETGDHKYLKQAQNAFDFVVTHPNFPEDAVPYWDFDAPDIPNEPRDASAAAIIASALYELAKYENREYYLGWADHIIKSLSSDSYRAALGENGNFILKHSVGSFPHHSGIDTPMNYADYYFVEAILRKRNIMN